VFLEGMHDYSTGANKLAAHCHMESLPILSARQTGACIINQI